MYSLPLPNQLADMQHVMHSSQSHSEICRSPIQESLQISEQDIIE
jgi:hypothetical protein